MSDRKLASIRRIDRVVPHSNADRLEIAHIGGWPAVVAKGDFRAGDLVVFCEIDCLLPPRPEYDYLAKSCSHTEPDGTEWYRIKTARLRGQLSQGLVLPVSILETIMPPLYRSIVEGSFQDSETGENLYLEHLDLTEALGIRKYEKPIAPNLAGVALGTFPHCIPKTDEERIQNLDIAELAGRLFYLTEKLDGSSCTIYCNKGEVGVCSRNLELVESPDNTFWKVAEEANVLKLCRASKDYQQGLAFQGEVVGPGIQGNPYKLDKHEFFCFNIYDIMLGRYLHKQQVVDVCTGLNIPIVPQLGINPCPHTIDGVLADAEGASALNTEVQREGVVWVSESGERVSFKAISNKFLLKSGD